MKRQKSLKNMQGLDDEQSVALSLLKKSFEVLDLTDSDIDLYLFLIKHGTQRAKDISIATGFK
jgi:hypothetical protein